MRAALIGLTILAAVYFATSAHARVELPLPPTPEEELDKALLARDADSLIGYLARGLPVDYVPPTLSKNEPNAHRVGWRRFYYFRHVVPALANLNDIRALDALRRVQSGELPDVVLADLDLWIAARTQFPSREEWDTLHDLERARLEMEASIAITRLAGDDSSDRINRLLKEWSANHMAIEKNEELKREILGFLRDSCGRLLDNRVELGIEALLDLVESPDPDIRYMAFVTLYRLTGQSFGPFFDTPSSAAKQDADKWRAWWSIHREIVMSGQRTLNQIARETREPAPETLRDYLVQLIDNGMAEWLPGKGPEDWLDAYAPKHPEELRKIVANVDERLHVRAHALEYLVQSQSAKKSYDAILEALQDRVVNEALPLHSTAFKLLQKHHPDKYSDTFERCINEDWPSAPAAIEDFAINGGRHILAANLSALKPELRTYTLDKLLWGSGPPEEALELALAGDNPEFAARAVKAARHPAIKALLSPEGLAHAERWERDPWCRYWLLVRTPRSEVPKGEYAVAMDMQHDEASPAAAVYAFVMHRTGESKAVKGFIRCVEAYRADRGRPKPLEELGYRFFDAPASISDEP